MEDTQEEEVFQKNMKRGGDLEGCICAGKCKRGCQIYEDDEWDSDASDVIVHQFHHTDDYILAHVALEFVEHLEDEHHRVEKVWLRSSKKLKVILK
jgi:hypothetical protein